MMIKKSNTCLIIGTISILSISILSSSLLSVYAEEKRIVIPQWVKNTAKWWADGKISDKKFAISVAFLIESKGIDITQNDIDSYYYVPAWLKNVAIFWSTNEITDNDFRETIQYLIHKDMIKIDQNTLDLVSIKGLDEVEYSGFSPFFRTFAYAQDFRILNGKPTPLEAQYALIPQLYENGTYNQIAIWDKPHSAAVVVPIFTSTAYWEPGFYTHYRGNCDTSCLTKKIVFERPGGFSASQNAVNVLKLLGYDSITDLDIDENPQILKQYDKIIVLHNEYVTKKEFDAITNHPKVIYLYANALYAEVKVNYENDTITLIKGHGYPSPDILNAFNWKYE